MANPEKPAYTVYEAYTESSSPSPTVMLLARTTTTIPEGVLTEEQWKEINSVTVMAGEAARSCYSKRLITPLDYVLGTEKHREISDGVVTGTLKAGHLTTRQHVNYVFGLSGVSRLAIWEAFHSYPHYNSDQESQRYVEMSEAGLMFPSNEPVIRDASLELIRGYNRLTEILTPVAMKHYLARFPRKDSPIYKKSNDDEALKRAQEVARYLLPQSMTANFYYSISELTLLRLHSLERTYNAKDELTAVLETMIKAIDDVDPSIQKEIGTPIEKKERDIPENNYLFSDEFDNRLEGKPVKVYGTETLLPAVAEAVRTILGYRADQMSDKEAIDLALDPAKNKLLASVGGEMVMDQISQALNMAYIRADVSLSLSADAQLQRHRGLNHLVPELFVPRNEEDIVVPALLEYSPEGKQLYLDVQRSNIEALRKVDSDNFRYLLTNGTRIRKTISGPLGPLFHMLKSRTCLNAQEEMYNIAVSTAKQLGGEYFDQPTPCGVRMRAGITPYCPEGDRTCGIPMFERRISTGYPRRSI